MQKEIKTNKSFNALIRIYKCCELIEKYYMRILKTENCFRHNSQLSDGFAFQLIQLKEQISHLDITLIKGNLKLRNQYKLLTYLRNKLTHEYYEQSQKILKKMNKIDVVLLKDITKEEILKFKIDEKCLEEILNKSL